MINEEHTLVLISWTRIPRQRYTTAPSNFLPNKESRLSCEYLVLQPSLNKDTGPYFSKVLLQERAEHPTIPLSMSEYWGEKGCTVK